MMMIPNTHTIQTTASSRDIRRCIQALTKSNAISECYKFPHVKHYITKEKRLTTTNIQILALRPADNRQKAQPILDNMLKDRSETV